MSDNNTSASSVGNDTLNAAIPVQGTQLTPSTVVPQVAQAQALPANSGPLVDFLSSAKRHIRDGDYLECKGYNENAGQLYGFVAECGLKALFTVIGAYPVDNQGSPVRSTPNLRNHIDGILPLLSNLDSYTNGRTSSYLTMLPNINEFSNWRVDHRYYNSSFIPQHLDKWKLGAREVVTMLEKASLDGVL